MALDGLEFNIVIDEAGEAVGASQDVDGLEKVGEHFVETFEIIVGWLFKDDRKGDGQLTKEDINIT